MTVFTDPLTVVPPGRPNTCLALPPGVDGRAPADMTTKAQAVPAARLATAWRQVVEAEPRTEILAVSEDGLQIEAEQRSALFRFRDLISFRAVRLDEGRSAPAIYSRSTLGYSDLGVNRRRLEAWLARLDDRIRTGG